MFSLAPADAADKPCRRRVFDGGSSFVCMCSANYCDTVERHGTLKPDDVVGYSSSKSGHRFSKTVLTVDREPRGRTDSWHDFWTSFYVNMQDGQNSQQTGRQNRYVYGWQQPLLVKLRKAQLIWYLFLEQRTSPLDQNP